MNDLLQWVLILGAEVVGFIFLLLLVYWIKHSSKRRKDRKAIADLVAKTQAAKAQREEVIETYLSENMGLSDKALKKATKKIIREEMRLIQGFANAYKEHDTGAAAQFNIAFEEAVSPYHELTGGASVVAAGGAVDGDDLEALRAENARLSEELTVTMDTMTRMLDEYSTMFSGATPQSSVVMPDDGNGEEEQVSQEQEPAVIESEKSEEVVAEEQAAEEELEITPDEQSVVEDGSLDDLFDTDDLDELDLADGAEDDNKTFAV